MGYLSQDSAGAANANKGVISMWIRPPAQSFEDTGDFVPILEFGDGTVGDISHFSQTSLLWVDSGGLGVRLWSTPVTLTTKIGHTTWLRETSVAGPNPSIPGPWFAGDLSYDFFVSHGFIATDLGGVTFDSIAARDAAVAAQQTAGDIHPYWSFLQAAGSG